MKRKLSICLLLVLLLALALPETAWAEPGLQPITDAAGLLTEEQVSGLNTTAAQIADTVNCGLYVVTLDDYLKYNREGMEECSAGIYDYYNLGMGEKKEGVMLLLSMAQREYYVTSFGDFPLSVMDEQAREKLFQSLDSSFAGDDWYSGVLSFLSITGTRLSNARGAELAAGAGETEQPAQAEETQTAEAQTAQSETGAGNGTLGFVTDTAGLLSKSEAEKLEQLAAAASERYGCGVYIVTVDDYTKYNPASVAECAESIYQHYHMGLGDERNGVLLLLSMAERDYDIAAYGEFGNYSFTDYGKEKLAEMFLDNFRNNDWNGGFTDYVAGCSRYLAAAQRGEPVDVPSLNESMPVPVKLAIVILLPCLIALISVSVMKSKMKTAREKTTAENYLVTGRADLKICEDRFVNRTQHVEIIQESDHRSGGGGTTVGASGFSHHSGKF